LSPGASTEACDREITLHVGYGTFQPVRVEHVEDHRVEPERYEIGRTAAETITAALREKRRIVAVGTTTTRTLETVAREHEGQIVPGTGWADVFIYPGFTFRVISGLLTNFHLPRSSLLMLVSAFAGRERVLNAYRHAPSPIVRFYSYGGPMLRVVAGQPPPALRFGTRAGQRLCAHPSSPG
jgi:S-adenosylmethionine:tRNA ribosyltransferase-isomerase